MTINSIYTIIITLITVLGGAGAWKYYERRLELARQKEREEEQQVHLFRDDLIEGVTVLETKLEEALKREVSLLEEIRKLSETVAALKVEIEYLRRENTLLKTQAQSSSD